MSELTPFSADSPTAQRPAPEAMGYSPPIGHWGNPYIGPVGSPVFSPGFVPPHIYYSDLYGRDTGRTLSNSNSTSSSLSDDVLFVTEDPNYSEHYHQYQSRVRIMDEQPLVHVSPFYPTPPGPVVPLTLDMAYVASPNVYRTIHSDASPQESPISTQPERLLPVPPPATLPPKPITAIEESKKKNFFPISWRVIGGGVLMGSESKPSAEPGTLNFVDGGMDEAPFGENKSDEKASPPKPNKRTRSSSIPPAPKTSHVDTGAVCCVSKLGRACN
ncbi:hypothetical protein C0991_007737 [Blastosporella zonata]|nr:hypothetical protein C0991_007737 [Blastosporella zonata]